MDPGQLVPVFMLGHCIVTFSRELEYQWILSAWSCYWFRFFTPLHLAALDHQ